MGKKSLFEPTVAPKKAKKKKAAPEVVEKTDSNNTTMSAEPVPEPEATAVVKPATEVPPPAVDAPAPEVAAPLPEVEAAPVETPGPPCGQDLPVYETDGAPSGPDIPCFEADVPPFENDPLIDQKQLLLGIAGFCGLIIVLLIASMVNADNYFVRQTRGRVEIWKGDFTPAGKDRILILHGTRWNRPVRSSYSRQEVFFFAATYYLEKAMALLDNPESDDFERIAYYLDRVADLFPGEQFKDIAATISQAGKYLTEARILQASGEKEAIALAREKIHAVGGVLEGLLSYMAGEDREAEKVDSGH